MLLYSAGKISELVYIGLPVTKHIQRSVTIFHLWPHNVVVVKSVCPSVCPSICLPYPRVTPKRFKISKSTSHHTTDFAILNFWVPVPWTSVSNGGILCRQQKFDQHSAISRKRCKRGGKLLCTHKSRLVPKLLTLNDLERRTGTSCYFALFHQI